jgi:negative modulator of initiation of replication
MKTIEIDDDVYQYLRQRQTTFSGESASMLLRKLLNLRPPSPHETAEPRPRRPLPQGAEQLLQGIEDKIQSDTRIKALWDFLKGPQFRAERNAVGRFLTLLALLYRENRDNFSAVENINGRSRKYFARTESELARSGTSVHPKRIPGSEYWVVTNNSSQSKCELLLQVLRTLGYDGGFAAFVATAALRKGNE